uniref:Uncharacterized protein n=1 Tax=Rhizophora mucronata TaxID=61149 RepID=A0A2P2QJM1_RHIMU
MHKTSFLSLFFQKRHKGNTA